MAIQKALKLYLCSLYTDILLSVKGGWEQTSAMDQCVWSYGSVCFAWEDIVYIWDFMLIDTLLEKTENMKILLLEIEENCKYEQSFEWLFTEKKQQKKKNTLCY